MQAQTIPDNPSVVNFTLIDADTNQPIPDFDPIPEGAELSFILLGTRHLNIRANTNPPTIGSVKFGYDANQSYRVESFLPYALQGDGMNGDYYSWTPAVGSHTLTATTYSGAKASGDEGVTTVLHFSVLDNSTPIISSTALPWVGKRTFYISSSGNDLNTGTSINDPWQTVSKVNSYIITNGAPGDCYLFKRGDSFKGPLQVLKKSGTSIDPIVFADYGIGTLPVIHQSNELAAWTLSSTPGVYWASLSYEPKVVNFDDVLKSKGRYPKRGYKIYNVPTGTIAPISSLNTDPNDPLPDDPSWVGSEIVIRTGGQTFEVNQVASHSSGMINLAKPLSHFNRKAGYFFRNHMRALTGLGDWMYSAEEQKLYMYFGSGGPAGHRISVDDPSSLTSGCIYLNQDYLVLHNLKIKGAPTGIFFKSAHHNLVQDCEIAICQMGSSSNGDSSFNEFKNNVFHDLGSGAVRTPTLDNQYYTFENNQFKNIGLILDLQSPSATGGIALMICGDGHVVRGNRFQNLGFSPIYFSNDKILVENNYIDGYGKTKDDAGAIYCWGDSNDNARATSRIVRNNIVLNGCTNSGVYGNYTQRVYGLYPDTASTVTYENNFVYGLPGDPVAVVSSSKINIRNNILVVTTPGRHGISMAASSKGDVTECNSSGNVILCSTNQNGVFLIRYGGVYKPLNSYGTFSDNYYRSSRTNCFRGASKYYTLTEWQTATASDYGSTFEQVQPSDANKLVLDYNDTLNDVVIELGSKTYRNLMSKEIVTGTITLKPFQSIALIETP